MALELNGTYDKVTILDVIGDIQSAEDLTFRPFTKLDWDAFAGAEEGSKIAEGERFLYILDPDGTVTVFGNTDGHFDDCFVIEMRAF